MRRVEERPRISLGSSKGSATGAKRDSLRRLSWGRMATPMVAPIGPLIELGHLQQARELLDEIRNDLTGEIDVASDLRSLQGVCRELSMTHTKSGTFAVPEAGAKSVMTSVQRTELHRLLRGKGLGDNNERLADLCCKMHFFKRLTRNQLLDFFSAAEFIEKDTAELIYKDGDPMGHVYVVLNGSVVIHRALQENALATDPGARGQCRAFVSSCFDGHAFGDGWDYAGKQSVRYTTAVAQEKSFLLRLDTVTYRDLLRKGDVCSDKAAALKELPFLQDCSATELESLLLMLESVSFHYLSRVLEPEQQPIACHVLLAGRCELRAFGIEVKELLAGAFFGLGVLLGLNYGARKGIEIIVSSMTAQFYFIKRKSLLPLPDIVQDSILKSVRELVDAHQDPLQEDGREVTKQNRRWRKQKQKSLAEVRRTSGKRKMFKATARVWHPPGLQRPTERPMEVPMAPVVERRPASAPAERRSLAGTSLGSSPHSPLSAPRRSLSSSRQFSMTPSHGRCQIPAFADDGRPMAVFGRTSEGFVMLSYPAPLSPLYSEVG